MRQYAIFYQRSGGQFVRLEPFVAAGLYHRVEVQDAVEHMRINAAVEGMVVRTDDELFNIMAYDKPQLDRLSFPFEDAITQNEPLDARSVLREAGLKMVSE